ncbi:MAG: helix-turn-helix transcriptional regulator [Ruminococcaceae bacterium]|nr:helix-turn-helix transcriptional regulator [Oscillospiraceae bacterium]
MPDNKQNKKNTIFYAVIFGAQLFLNIATFRLATQADAVILSAEKQEEAYYFYQLLFVLGLLTFPLLCRVISGDREKRILSVTLMLFYALSVTTTFVYPAAAHAFVSTVMFLCVGHMCARFYWLVSMAMGRGGRLGLALGAGSAGAYLLQYVFQMWKSALLPLAAVMLICFALLASTVRRMDPIKPAEAEETKNEPAVPTKALICACVVTAAIITLNCFYNGYIQQLQVRSGFVDYNAYTWPRLLLVPGCLAFGLLADVKEGKYLPISVLCTVLVTLLNPILPFSEGTYWLNMCLFYLAVAAAISYYNLTFCALAPRTRHPELWAGMGRALDGSLVTVLGLLGFSEASVSVVLGTDIAMLATIIAAMAMNGDLSLTALPAEPHVSPVSPSLPDDDVLLARFSAAYGLTPRETDVVHALLTSGGDQQRIAEKLNIRVSTLQHHTTSIYRKTGAENRADLGRLYRESIVDGM